MVTSRSVQWQGVDTLRWLWTHVPGLWAPCAVGRCPGRYSSLSRWTGRCVSDSGVSGMVPVLHRSPQYELFCPLWLGVPCGCRQIFLLEGDREAQLIQASLELAVPVTQELVVAIEVLLLVGHGGGVQDGDSGASFRGEPLRFCFKSRAQVILMTDESMEAIQGGRHRGEHNDPLKGPSPMHRHELQGTHHSGAPLPRVIVVFGEDEEYLSFIPKDVPKVMLEIGLIDWRLWAGGTVARDCSLHDAVSPRRGEDYKQDAPKRLGPLQQSGPVDDDGCHGGLKKIKKSIINPFIDFGDGRVTPGLVVP